MCVFTLLNNFAVFRCPNCLAEISFKTDIENVDYTAEHGATRLFEAFKFYQEQEKEKELKEEAEKNDAMKMLEKRTQMSRAEMEAAGKVLARFLIKNVFRQAWKIA